MTTTTPPEIIDTRPSFIIAHSIATRKPVTLVKPAGSKYWKITIVGGLLGELQIRLAIIEKEIRKIKPEEYGPVAYSLFLERTALKKQIRMVREKKVHGVRS